MSEDGVTAVAALGGHGMTLSFGLAEAIVAGRIPIEPVPDAYAGRPCRRSAESHVDERFLPSSSNHRE
jgi:hypothetical protein